MNINPMRAFDAAPRCRAKSKRTGQPCHACGPRLCCVPDASRSRWCAEGREERKFPTWPPDAGTDGPGRGSKRNGAPGARNLSSRPILLLRARSGPWSMALWAPCCCGSRTCGRGRSRADPFGKTAGHGSYRGDAQNHSSGKARILSAARLDAAWVRPARRKRHKKCSRIGHPCRAGGARRIRRWPRALPPSGATRGYIGLWRLYADYVETRGSVRKKLVTGALKGMARQRALDRHDLLQERTAVALRAPRRHPLRKTRQRASLRSRHE
jgi:hypothetical protein